MNMPCAFVYCIHECAIYSIHECAVYSIHECALCGVFLVHCAMCELLLSGIGFVVNAQGTYDVYCIQEYRVATISRLLKITGLFCRIPSLLYGSFAKETYNSKEPTNRSHPICASCIHCETFT